MRIIFKGAPQPSLARSNTLWYWFWPVLSTGHPHPPVKGHPKCIPLLFAAVQLALCVSHLIYLLVLLATQSFNTTLINWFPVVTFESYIFEKLHSRITVASPHLPAQGLCMVNTTLPQGLSTTEHHTPAPVHSELPRAQLLLCHKQCPHPMHCHLPAVSPNHTDTEPDEAMTPLQEQEECRRTQEHKHPQSGGVCSGIYRASYQTEFGKHPLQLLTMNAKGQWWQSCWRGGSFGCSGGLPGGLKPKNLSGTCFILTLRAWTALYVFMPFFLGKVGESR